MFRIEHTTVEGETFEIPHTFDTRVEVVSRADELLTDSWTASITITRVQEEPSAVTCDCGYPQGVFHLDCTVS
jgi:hypothetical protein